MRAKLLTWPWVVLGVAVAAYGQEKGTKLETTDGGYVRLEELFHGRPAIVFYEDREGSAANLAFKEALFREGRQKNLLNAADVVAVANVQRYDWFPARSFVVSAVKKTEAEVNVPVYLDWTGALTRAPWALSATGSTVLVLDAKGRTVLTKTGVLSPDERKVVLERLEALLAP